MTIQATYENGWLKPAIQLDLPEGVVVQVEILPLSPADRPATLLFGAYPDLAALTDDEFAWAERLWEHGLEKQSRILDGLAEE